VKQSELISTIAERTGFGKGQVTRMLATLIEVCRGELIAEGQVQLAGLGTFLTRERQPREGRNPATGAKIQIAAKRHVKFTISTALRKELNPPAVVARQPRRRA
jgi:DNA-binding protein HU-beta